MPIAASNTASHKLCHTWNI